MTTARTACLFLIGTVGLLLPQTSGAEHPALLKSKGIWRVTAPPELAKSERVVTKDSGYEGTECVPGLAYGDRELAIFSTNAAALYPTRRLEAVDHFLASGGVDELNLTDLVCSDAAITHIAALGTVDSKLFDRQQLFLADVSQDSCGDTDVMALAKKGPHYFVLTVGLKELLSTPTCEEAPIRNDGDCDQRFACLKSFFADPAHAGELKSKWVTFLKTLRFGN